MPDWAQDDPRTYWAAADENERANGRLYRDIEFALPKELSERQQVALARAFSASVTTGTGERLPYTLAVHHGEGENPHAHLMFSERGNDGIARSAAQWFRRYNPKSPDQGGAKKSEATKPKAWLEQTRASWAEQATARWPRRGVRSRFTPGAWRSSSPRPSAATTPSRSRAWRIGSPGCISAHTTSRGVERGSRWSGWPRPARSRTATRRSQRSARTCPAWSRPCTTCGMKLPRPVKALADYAREYWDRNRQEQIARDRDDLGRTR